LIFEVPRIGEISCVIFLSIKRGIGRLISRGINISISASPLVFILRYWSWSSRIINVIAVERPTSVLLAAGANIKRLV
jgi:hypothetical protein